MTGRLAALLAGFAAPVPALLDTLGPGAIAQTVATVQARRRPRAQWVLAQTHRRDRTRNLPPALRNLVLRRWGRSIFHASHQPVLELP